MASLSQCHHNFDRVAAARMSNARRGKGIVVAYPGHTWSDLIELEFSDLGRDSRYPSGWYIAPVILTLLLLIPLAL